MNAGTPPVEVRIREVGPRDGFQNEPEVIPTDVKVRLIEMLARTGVRRLEALPIPTLALVHGLCLTAGLEVSLGCDLIWATESAP